MNNKEMKIIPPEGYEIDTENSTFECIKFKPIPRINPNIITSNPTFANDKDYKINRNWAFSMFVTEAEGNGYKGQIRSGHSASLFLCDDNRSGTWYDEKGNKISNYLFYKPN